MPAIRQISVVKNELRFTRTDGSEKVFDMPQIPLSIKTDVAVIAKLEDYINNSWIPTVVDMIDVYETDAKGNVVLDKKGNPIVIGTQPAYQVVVKIMNASPLELNVYTANIGEVIPDNWWIDESDPNIKP